MTQPVPPMQRPRYFDYQFLRADDFVTEQRYHRSRRELLTALFYSPGVVSGLTVTCTDTTVTVAAGHAVDRLGQLIVLPAPVTVAVVPATGDVTLLVTVRYDERATDPSDETGVPGETRWTEEPKVELVAAATAGQVVLGTFRRTAGKGTADATGRTTAGLVIPGQYTVKGNLTADGDISGRNLTTKDVRATGAITPSVGNSAANGIMFPRDPGGGVGDEAYIRYFPYGGESTMLVIGTGNDPEDLIDFWQQNAPRLRIGGGMLHLGKLDGTIATANEVIAALGFHGPGIQHAQLSFRAGRGFEFVDRSADGPALGYPVDSKPYADVYARAFYASGDIGIAPSQRIRSAGRMHLRTAERLYLLARDGVHITRDEENGTGNLYVAGNVDSQGDLLMGAGKTLVGRGRLHLADPSKVVISNQYWGGNGLLHVQGGLSVGDYEPVANRVTAWDGRFGGGVYVGDTDDLGACPLRMYNNGDIRTTGIVYGREKKFLIDHPLDPQGQHLVHCAIEGAENAVYYRGEARLAAGRAVVELPSYFEALTRTEERTVQLTPVFEDDDEPLAALAASRVRDGRFTVRTVDGSAGSFAFCWEVKAVRADVERLDVEVDKAEFDRRHEAPAAPAAPAAAGSEGAPAGHEEAAG